MSDEDFNKKDKRYIRPANRVNDLTEVAKADPMMIKKMLDFGYLYATRGEVEHYLKIKEC